MAMVCGLDLHRRGWCGAGPSATAVSSSRPAGVNLVLLTHSRSDSIPRPTWVVSRWIEPC
jgi:hypothetical protein